MPRRAGVTRHAYPQATDTTTTSTDSDNMDRTPSKRLVNGVNGLTVDEATQRVHLAVRALLVDEFPDLAKRKGLKLNSETGQYLQLTWTSFKSYCKCIWKTWVGVCFCFVKMCLGQMCKRLINSSRFHLISLSVSFLSFFMTDKLLTCLLWTTLAMFLSHCGTE
jgi:hypothetical protein